MNIQDFTKDTRNNLLTVDTDKETCHINLSDFEAWLDRTDRLDWESNHADHTGSHVQSSGRFNMEDYWESPYVTGDISDYITIHFVDAFNLQLSLNKILSHA